MTPRYRRTLLLAAGATLTAGLTLRKPLAASGATLSGATLSGAPKLAPLPGSDVPEFHFTTADGAPRTLADYKGQGVVLNFWATWCVPCVAEMPALAALAGLVRGSSVVVLPLSSDRGGAAAVERFYRERGVEGLPVLLDPRGEAARAFATRGIPTTVLIDKNGRERGRLEGAADWASPDAVAAVRELAR
ncbi:MAG: hypothetical protein NVSMB18_35410 [Acetobacteraceae bacterium]